MTLNRSRGRFAVSRDDEPVEWTVTIAAAPEAARQDLLARWTLRMREGAQPMDVFAAIRTLLAVRDYEDRPVPDDVVRRMLEAGRLTGSAGNKQPWHFIVVQDREMLRQLGAVARSGPYIAQAPLAIVVVVKRTPYAVSDASRAIQDMLLTAWDEGVGGNWAGFGELEAAKPLLGIPAELDVLAIVPFGYPAARVGQGKKARKPLAEIAHRERWGTPYG
ncbi:MAG: nitroreductase family protein [Thermomicrobiales bacterium]